MNTADPYHIPKLEQTGMKDYEFILEDLELAFPRKQIEEITKDWNNGSDIELIAKQQKRPVEEIFLALFHQAMKRKIKRPFAYRRKLNE